MFEEAIKKLATSLGQGMHETRQSVERLSEPLGYTGAADIFAKTVQKMQVSDVEYRHRVRQHLESAGLKCLKI